MKKGRGKWLIAAVFLLLFTPFFLSGKNPLIAHFYKVNYAHVFISSLNHAVLIYHDQYGVLPETLDEAGADENIRNDFWGREILYEKSAGTYRIYSLGRDVNDSSDDIHLEEHSKLESSAVPGR